MTQNLRQIEQIQLANVGNQVAEYGATFPGPLAGTQQVSGL